MLCTTAPDQECDSNVNENRNNELKLKSSFKKSKSKSIKGKVMFNEPEVVLESIPEQESYLKGLSIAFSTDENDNGNILIQNDSFINNTTLNKNEEDIIRNSSNESINDNAADNSLANGNISKNSYDDDMCHSQLNLSCSSIRPNETHANGGSSKSSLVNAFSEDESFVYNSHLSEIDRNEDIKDLQIKLKKAIKSLDKKKKDLTLAAVIGQCLLEANTNLKTINTQLMNKRGSGSSSFSELNQSSSFIQNNKHGNNTRVYEGVGRQEKNHLNIFPENGNIDENTYNSVVEYHEDNYNRVIKQLTDINNQLECNNFDLRKQVNDLEEVVKETKNKYNRGLVESEKKLNEMEEKLNTMTELNNKLFKDNQDLMKEFSNNNHNKNIEIKQERNLIDTLYNELYDMQQKIEEVNNSKEKCEKKYEKLNMEYIKSKDEIDELKKLNEQNKIIEQVINEKEHHIQELNEYMEYQRDYISRLENQLFLCTFNPVSHPKLNNNLLKQEEDDRIVELKDTDKDNSNNNERNYSNSPEENMDSYNYDNQISINEEEEENHSNIDNNCVILNQDKNNENLKKNEDSESRYQNSQLVLYSPNIFHQLLTNISNNANFMNSSYIDNTSNNHQINELNINTSSKKEVNINDIKTGFNSEIMNIKGNMINHPETKLTAKKRININGNGTITKQIIYEGDVKKKRRASTNNIPSDQNNWFNYNNDRPRRKSLNTVPNNQFIYSYGNPLINNNSTLLKSSDESINRDFSDLENEKSLDIFQHDIKKIFKPRPPIKKMKMNKQEKKMIKKIKKDKLNDIIQTSENSISYTPSSSSVKGESRNSSFNSTNSKSVKNSFVNVDSRMYFTSKDFSDVQSIPSQDFANNNSNSNNENNINNNINNINNKNELSVTVPNKQFVENTIEKRKNNVEKKSASIVPLNTNNKNYVPSPLGYNNRYIKPNSPMLLNSYQDVSSSGPSFLKQPKRTFRSLLFRNPFFSSNFTSSNLSSSNISTSPPSISSNIKIPKNNDKKNNNTSSNIIKSNDSTMDLNSFTLETDLSTQIIIKNDSEINDCTSDLKTSEILWNKENNVGKELLHRNSTNKDVPSPTQNNVDNSESNISVKGQRNKLAKMLIRGWIHMVDGLSLFNPYHNNYRLDSYVYNRNEKSSDNNSSSDDNSSSNDNSSSSSNNEEDNEDAPMPFGSDHHRLPTSHFFNFH